MRRRDFLKKAGWVVGSAPLLSVLDGCANIGTRAAKDLHRPNIVFIMADDLGYAELGCYGQKKIKTPNIDRLAAEGVKFTQAYAGCTVCAPSRSVLMTGLHMGHTPVRANGGGIPLLPEDVTVAEVLKKAGYATGCFGKWGLGDIGTTGVPTKQGFDEFFGYLHQIHAHYYYPDYLWDGETEFPLKGNENDGRKQYSHDIIMKRALSFIRRNADRPFFCYLPVTIPHVELFAPDGAMQQYKGKFAEPSPFVDPSGHAVDQPLPRTTHAAMISCLDKSVGELMTMLRQLNLDDNTIVFFASDNGGTNGGGIDAEFFNSNGPLRNYKTTLYEGGIRVPMVARWPGHIAPGTTSNLVCYFPDVMPTFAELAGAGRYVPGHIDGISIVPELLAGKTAGAKQKHHKYLYWEYGRGLKFKQAVRMGNYKAVRSNPNSPLRLYDLSADIGETTDIAGQDPEIVAKIKKNMVTARTKPRPQKEPKSTEWFWPCRKYKLDQAGK